MDERPRRGWVEKPADAALVARLARELRLQAPTARVLVGRGLADPVAAAAFLRPRLSELRPPSAAQAGVRAMAGFDAAVERLVRAVTRGELVAIFGDYDVDGVTSTAILGSSLRAAGAQVVTRVARRDEGYGFGEAPARELLGQQPGVIVTLDCGTSDVGSIAACRAAGVDVVVVDHHQVPDRTEHPATALVNPHRADSGYPFRGLCSAGLAFFLAAGVRTGLKAAGWFAGRREPDPRELLDLVALGTIADVAPLVEENRILVAAGLRTLSERRRPGVAALLAVAGVPADRAVDEIDVAWKLAPRLNAPGRLGDAQPALALLLADATEAEARAAELEALNDRRRALQEIMLQEALVDAEQVAEHAALVVARPGWHHGVAGIVAAKLVDRYQRPAAVIAVDEATGVGRGSLRSANGFNLYQSLVACREHLVRYGGHAAAAGVTVEAERVAAFREAFAACAAAAGAGEPEPHLVDAVVPLARVTLPLVDELRLLAPFGAGNEAPVLAAPAVRVVAARSVGEDQTHLRLTVACAEAGSTHAAIAFRMAHLAPAAGAAVDLVFAAEASVFRGERKVDVKVKEILPPSRAPAGLLPTPAGLPAGAGASP